MKKVLPTVMMFCRSQGESVQDDVQTLRRKRLIKQGLRY